MKKEFLVVFLGAVLLAVAFSWAMPVGRTVTMNLAFSIGTDKNSDVLRAYSNFSSSHNTANGTVVGLIINGQPFNTTTNASYSSSANLLAATQYMKGNQFIITATNGTASQLAGRISQMGDGQLPSTTLGLIESKMAQSFPLYIILQYDDIDLQNDLIFSGAEEFIIRNFGNEPDGRANITFELVA